MLAQLLISLLAILPTAGDGVCSGDWRGVPLNKALQDVSRRCQVKYLADASLPAEAMEREVRLSVRHLTGQQAARWLARLAGLESIEVEGSLVLATPQRAKLIARELSPGDAGQRAKADANTWRSLKGRRSAVNWDQTPLSRVASDVSTWFGVDVIYHPDLLSEPLLVTVSRPDADMAQVAAALADQLHATVEFLDGALWVHPSPQSAMATTKPALESPAAEIAKKPAEPSPSAPPEPSNAEPLNTVEPPKPEPAVAGPEREAAASPQREAAASPEREARGSDAGNVPLPGSAQGVPPAQREPVTAAPATQPAAQPPLASEKPAAPPEKPAAQQPAAEEPATPATDAQPSPGKPSPASAVDSEKALDKPLVLDRSVGNWQELAVRIRQAAGIGCSIQVPPGATYPGFAADGTVREVLEAGRLLGYLSWSMDPASRKGPGGIRIAVLARG
jgi:hypothetical protein